MSEDKISKKICFLYTETNGLHDFDENVSKKNLYGFARLVVLNYEIGCLKNDVYIKIISKRIIIKPRCMYIYENSIKFHEITNEIAHDKGFDIEETLNTFLSDLNDVSFIVSHNVFFHIRTIQSECIRYNIQNNFLKFTIIDTISFVHKYSLPQLIILYENIYKKSPKNKPKLDLIKLCFIKLYNNKKSNIEC